jgi:hypothetical protein
MKVCFSNIIFPCRKLLFFLVVICDLPCDDYQVQLPTKDKLANVVNIF